MFAVSGHIDPVTVADNRVPPVIQHLHMLALHEGLRLNAHFLLAELGLSFLNGRGVGLGLRLGIGLAEIIVKRECHEGQENRKPDNYLSAVIHFQHPPSQEGVQDVYPLSFPFPLSSPGHLPPIRELRQQPLPGPSIPLTPIELPCQ